MYNIRYLAPVLIAFLMISTASAQSQLILEIEDSNGQIVPATFQVENESGIVAESENKLNTSLATNQNYTVRQQIPSHSTNITIHNLNLTSDQSPEIRLTNRTSNTPYLEAGEKIYALNDDQLTFENAQISYERQNTPENILHCTQYRFSNTECSSWNINSSTNYDILQEASTFQYNVTSFSAYTAGNTAPRLNITNLQIFNVTGLSSNNQKYEGNLIDEGLNKTLQTEQKDQNAEFRFTFNIENTGTEDWEHAAADTITHTGIDTDWTVNQIWYNTSTEYNGGTFSSGQVSWDTDTTATLTTGQQMNASYVAQTNLQDTQLYDQVIDVEDSSTNAEDTDQHILEAIKYGRISAELLTPPNNTIVTQNKTFNLTANLTCTNGECGAVEATPRYNNTDGQQIIGNEGEKPFALQENALQTCNLSSGEECSIGWITNATGDIDTYHELDVNTSSTTYTGIPANSSDRNIVEISLPIDFNLDWGTIDFGALNPGVQDQPAEGNADQQYNITVSEDSKPIDNLWIKGTDLVSTENPDYFIGVENISYSLENDIESETSISKNYQHVTSNLDPGEVLPTFYWLDIPFGMTEGGYNGTITFKANITG